ncbi:hypothetical protein ACJ73_10176 [Blastomyces percursus]|uniref:Uncharacterized protein n=1 Tax=Blastomyces percursus TaxID=1658174 RepID=A0A1J9PP59_9EURO|nr:hypothetical protein ACJ73_10176 [Blastomyces percursus]
MRQSALVGQRAMQPSITQGSLNPPAPGGSPAGLPGGLNRSSPVAFPHRSPRTKGAPRQQRTGEQIDWIKPREKKRKREGRSGNS